MRRFGLTPLLVLAAVATAMLVAARQTPYFPGDLALARGIQSVAPAGAWARAVTRAAYAPWIYGVLAVSAIAALRVAGWRGAAAMIVTFFALMQLETGIKETIRRPRPSSSLVQVSGSAPAAAPAMMAATASPARPSYSMPSGWALLFGSTVGVLAVLAWTRARGAARVAYVAGCALVLAAGLLARVSLGQHWPSDVIAGYLLAIAIGLGLMELLATIPGSSRTSAARRSSRPTR